ncbi:MAG TPA: single-stranded-DNA-specific exonuclease RecJ [Candidatus Baltobacteraceae bacterium]|nr:single-stranded-DNA-specific exonuclease RecJ [Candidatus Baltobacteraceae bacterium]
MAEAKIGRRWRIAETDAAGTAALAEALAIPSLLAHLLIRRGCTTADTARLFLDASLAALPDPLQMTGMSQAVARLQHAISRHEPIWVCGDFDVDGVTGMALLVSGLTRAGADVSYAVPTRHEHGYGLPAEIVGQAADAGARVLVAVDHGITAHEAASLALQRGLDLIICDHHLPPPTLPPAMAILNPRQPGCGYPFPDLCGVGIAFKLIQALYGPDAGDECWPLLDLVALGTIADLVPLVGENRILVKHGLAQLAITDRPGLRALAEVAGIRLSEAGGATPGRVAFGLAPRINAAGRLMDARVAVRLLLTPDPFEARELAAELDKHNRDRQALEAGILEAALAQAEATHDLDRDRAIVVQSAEWHPGVLGIVASRLVERYNRPAALIATMGAAARGSVRSACGFHVADALQRCADLLTHHGGHRAAGGFSLGADRIDAFRTRFLQVAAETIADEALEPSLDIDAEVELDRLDLSLVDWLARLSPHGLGNPEPLLATRHVQVMRYPRKVGRNHLKIRVREPGGDGRVVDAIGFNLGEYAERLEAAQAPRIDLAYVPERNTWNGRDSLQLRIRDLHSVSE